MSKTLGLNLIVAMLSASCSFFYSPETEINKNQKTDSKVQRRNLPEALAELQNLKQKDNQLSQSERLLVQDIAGDISVRLVDADAGQVKNAIDQLEKWGDSSSSSGKDFEITLLPGKSVSIPSKSYCLDQSLSVPSCRVKFKQTAPAEESNIRLIIAHHEFTKHTLGSYQSVIWEVENLDKTWSSVSSDLKQIIKDLNIAEPSDETKIKVFSESTDVKKFVMDHHLVEKGMPDLDMTWTADGYRAGILTAYNGTEKPIKLNSNSIVARFKPVAYVERASNATLSSLNQVKENFLEGISKTSETFSRVAETSGNECSEDSDNPKVQDIWAGTPEGENLANAADAAVSDAIQVAHTLTNRGQNISASERTRLRLGAELLATGSRETGRYILTSMNSSNSRSAISETLSAQSNIEKIDAIDFSKNDITIDQILDVAVFLSSQQTSTRVFVDSLARTRVVTPENYKTLLSLEEMRANREQIEDLRSRVRAALASGSANRTSDVYDSGKESANQLARYWPDIWNVLKHPSLIPNINSLIDAKNEALRKAQDGANQCAGDSLTDGYWDAYRHATWNALMSEKVGSCKAEWVGNGHEDFAGNDPLSKEMDLHNNKLGRDVHDDLKKTHGREPTPDETSKEIRKRLDEGKGKVINGDGQNRKIETSGPCQ